MFVFDPGLIFAHSFDGPDFLVVREPGTHGVVREQSDDDYADYDRDQTHEEKHDLPRREGFGGIMLKAEGCECADDGTGSSPDIPETYSGRLLYESRQFFLLDP